MINQNIFVFVTVVSLEKIVQLKIFVVKVVSAHHNLYVNQIIGVFFKEMIFLIVFVHIIDMAVDVIWNMSTHKDTPKKPPAAFVAWLWSKRDLEHAFFPSTLTEDNKDDTLPRPALSQPEAEEVFRHLEDLKLVFPVAANGGTAYSINKLKPHEWDDAERELRKPKWKRSKTLRQCGIFILWVITLFIASFVGGISGKLAETVYEERIASHATPPPKIDGKEADKNKANAQKDEAKK